MEDAPSGANEDQKEIRFKRGQRIAPVRPFYIPLKQLGSTASQHVT